MESEGSSFSSYRDFILSTYNKCFDHIIVVECTSCTKNLAFEDGGTQFNIVKALHLKLSYVACIKIIKSKGNGDERTTIQHKCFPILLGSNIDKAYRPNNFEVFREKFGALLLDGEFKIIPNLLVNNNSIIGVKRGALKIKINATEHTHKLGSVSEPTQQQQLWDEIITHFPRIDTLANKVLLSPPHILARVLDFVSKTQSKKNMFISGHIGFIFSKQLFHVQTQRTSSVGVEKKSSSIYIPIEGQKHDKIKYLLGTTKRALPNENSINNAPLLYPIDGAGFIDPRSCKEFANAGVALQIAEGVIPSPPSVINIDDAISNDNTHFSFNTIVFENVPISEKLSLIYPQWVLDTQNRIVVNDNALSFETFLETKRMLPNYACYLSPKERYLIWSDHTGLVYNKEYDIYVSHTETMYYPLQLRGTTETCLLAHNGVPTKIKCTLTFEHYLDLKRKFLFAHVYQYQRFVHVVTCENLLLKYHKYFNIYVSPHEFNFLFQQELKFERCDEYQYFMPLYQILPVYVNNTSAPKITVTFNNIRGACYEIKHQEEYEAFLESPGYNMAVNFKGTYDYTHLAILPGRKQNKKRTYPTCFRNTYIPTNNALRVYVAFAHDPATVEDGFVIDKKFAQSGPILTSVINLTARIMLNNATIQPKDIKRIQLNFVQINSRVENTIIFGVLSAIKEIKVLQNKRVKVSKTQKMNGFYHYTLSYEFDCKKCTTMDTCNHIEITSYDLFAMGDPVISVRIIYELSIGVGTKLCNAYGQKGEIAAVQDLSHYVGFKSDGTAVHPQLLMSVISVVGRTAAGQVREMTETTECALTTNNGVIAPLDFWISAIHASNRLGTLTTRTDALKMCNGFDGNTLAATNMILSEQSSVTSKLANLKHALTLNEHKGIKFIFKP